MNMSFNEKELWLLKLSLTSRLESIDRAVEAYSNLNIDITKDSIGKGILEERKEVEALRERFFKGK